MKKYTVYESFGRKFYSEEEALKYEEKIKGFHEAWEKGCSRSKLILLMEELKKAQDVDPEIVATTGHDILAIRGMVQVCQKFVEECGWSLNHY